jgi:hypothetical protein
MLRASIDLSREVDYTEKYVWRLSLPLWPTPSLVGLAGRVSRQALPVKAGVSAGLKCWPVVDTDGGLRHRPLELRADQGLDPAPHARIGFDLDVRPHE